MQADRETLLAQVEPIIRDCQAALRDSGPESERAKTAVHRALDAVLAILRGEAAGDPWSAVGFVPPSLRPEVASGDLRF